MKKFLILALGLLLLPFSLGAQSLSDTEIGSLDFDALGSNTTLRMGEFAEIGRFRITNRGRRTLMVDRIRLRNYGNARLDESFENLGLYTGTEKINDDIQVSRNYITFHVPSTFIDRGDSLIFTVRGQLIYAKSNRRTVQLGVRRKEDILLKEASSGFFANCQVCEGVRLKTYTLRLGGLNIERSNYRPTYRYYGSRTNSYNPYYGRRTYRSTDSEPRSYNRRISTPVGRQSYSPGSKDIIFFSSQFSSKVPIEAEGIFLEVSSGNVSDKNGNGIANEIQDFSETFADFSLFVNGEFVDSTNGFERFNGRTGLRFDSTFIIWPSSQLVLRGRLTNQAQTGDKVRFKLNSNGILDPVYRYNYRSVPSVNINGGSTAPFREVESDLKINSR